MSFCVLRSFSVSSVSSVQIQLSGTAVVENSAKGTVVGTLTTSDPNPSDKFTYSLVGTDSNKGFAVVRGSILVTRFVPNYEVKSRYEVYE